jgi:hypothetical protein
MSKPAPGFSFAFAFSPTPQGNNLISPNGISSLCTVPSGSSISACRAILPALHLPTGATTVAKCFKQSLSNTSLAASSCISASTPKCGVMNMLSTAIFVIPSGKNASINIKTVCCLRGA